MVMVSGMGKQTKIKNHFPTKKCSHEFLRRQRLGERGSRIRYFILFIFSLTKLSLLIFIRKFLRIT